jgi:hypothetical protein
MSNDPIPRNTGRDADDDAWTELDHFGNCPVCGALVDVRDLAGSRRARRDAVGFMKGPPAQTRQHRLTGVERQRYSEA